MTKSSFSEDYIKFGFTSIYHSAEKKEHCVLCYKIFNNHS